MFLFLKGSPRALKEAARAVICSLQITVFCLVLLKYRCCSKRSMTLKIPNCIQRLSDHDSFPCLNNPKPHIQRGKFSIPLRRGTKPQVSVGTVYSWWFRVDRRIFPMLMFYYCKRTPNWNVRLTKAMFLNMILPFMSETKFPSKGSEKLQMAELCRQTSVLGEGSALLWSKA